MRKSIKWNRDPGIKKRVTFLVKKLKLSWIETKNIYCFKSINANTRAYARIWGLGRIWQQAIEASPSYIIEVISEKYDNLSLRQKDEVLLHELTHIPMNFSGALVPHIRRGKRKFDDRVRSLINQYLKFMH